MDRGFSSVAVSAGTSRSKQTKPATAPQSIASASAHEGEGTLVWIGDRQSSSFRDAYRFCEASSSQLAYRSDLGAALARPALLVRTIVWCRERDSVSEQSQFHRFLATYPEAEATLLLGPLCAGQRPNPQEVYGAAACAWSDWEAVLPNTLRRCGLRNGPAPVAGLIVIATRSRDNGTALAGLASVAGHHTIITNPSSLGRVSEADEVWWDDSATGRTPDWNALVKRFATSPTRHAWVTSFLTPNLRQQALRSGVSLVLRKPGDLSPLIRSKKLPQDQRVLEAA